jgi:ATP phosphoribosyltransferase regulatory subunit
MNAAPTLALLPAGFHDLLPPDAEREAALVERAMGVFRAHGYERVKPPLIEFEEGLLSGVGRAWARQSFRLLDPESQRMMAVRADMTLQVARVASSRLVKTPRPLRLCYTGDVLRLGGEQLSPERQLRQIGSELIGSLEPAADTEIVLLAAAALRELGVAGLSVDLNLPTILPALFKAFGLDGMTETRLSAAVAHRDAAVAGAAPGIGPLLAALIDVAGPAAGAVEKLERLELPAAAHASRARLVETVARIRVAAPDLKLTVDPVERKGFEYQSGLSFTLFARGSRTELGRGGRYRIGGGPSDGLPDDLLSGEPAVGFTLFADAVIQAAPQGTPPRRVYCPSTLPAADATRLRHDGWITVAGLVPAQDSMVEAKRLGCGYVYQPGAGDPRPVE